MHNLLYLAKIQNYQQRLIHPAYAQSYPHIKQATAQGCNRLFCHSGKNSFLPRKKIECTQSCQYTILKYISTIANTDNISRKQIVTKSIGTSTSIQGKQYKVIVIIYVPKQARKPTA